MRVFVQKDPPSTSTLWVEFDGEAFFVDMITRSVTSSITVLETLHADRNITELILGDD